MKVRENDFSLNGLLGFNFHGKTAGIVGTGKIGAAMARICRGFGMKVLAYDVCPNPSLEGMAEYVDLKTLLGQSDLGFPPLSPHGRYLSSDLPGYHPGDEGGSDSGEHLPGSPGEDR